MLGRLVYVLGGVVAAVGVAMLSAAGVSVLYAEWSVALQLTVAALITTAAGLAGWRWAGSPGEMETREGFAIVGLAWFVVAAFGTLPYLLTGTIHGLTDAFFESAAGFTTTGATVVVDPGGLPQGVLFWRALTQWLGGMGVIVLSVAVLPLLGVGALQLARAEWPGGQPDRLTPRFQETAKRLWYVYVGATGLQAVLLVAGEMDLFEAVAHSLTTIATGGFGTRADSFAGFSPYTQWVTIAFMLVGGTSFLLHYRALRSPGAYLRSPELRLFLLLVAGAVAAITIGNCCGQAPLPVVLREAAFTGTAIITTTGFAVTDFAQWSSGLQVLLVGLMFIGGMSGSTSGSVKVYRLAVLSRSSVADLRRIIHPRGVFLTRFGGEVVPEPVVRSVQSYFLFHMFLFMTATLLLAVIESGLAVGLDLVTSVSAVASALNNIGPGLGLVGPADTYMLIPAPGKWLLAFLMIVGRLEIFPVLLLLTPELWRR